MKRCSETLINSVDTLTNIDYITCKKTNIKSLVNNHNLLRVKHSVLDIELPISTTYKWKTTIDVDGYYSQLGNQPYTFKI